MGPSTILKSVNVIQSASELIAGGRKVCVAIGVFDGVHLGHQQVIRRAMADAQQQDGLAVVITFDRHPNAVVAPDRVPPSIQSLSQKLRTLDALGVDATWLIRFDEKFSQRTGEEFVRMLAGDFGKLYGVCVGSDFTFGRKRSGNVALLNQLGQELGFVVHGLSAVALDGDVVSSTRIREAIRTGNLYAASQMLGRCYSLAAAVVQGDQLGRKLGFPTANLDVKGMMLPPNGVYAVRAQVGERWFRAVLNIGMRPTVSSAVPELRVEVHLLGFDEEIYGQEMEITFVERLRDEQKFASLDALKEQISEDVHSAERLFGR